MQVTTLGIDLAKNVFRVHGCATNGKPVVRKQLSRRQLLSFVANLPPCLVAMEACASAHYWAREIEKFGHQVRLIAPRFVRPYVKANKNDASDAEAICEAASRPSMRFVAIKSAAQQDLQAVHRVRQQLVKVRTGLANQVRGLLAEHGILIARGFAPLRRALPVCGEFDLTRRPESETSPCSGDASDTIRVARAEARVRHSVAPGSSRPVRCDSGDHCKTSCSPRASIRGRSAAKTRFDPDTRAE